MSDPSFEIDRDRVLSFTVEWDVSEVPFVLLRDAHHLKAGQEIIQHPVQAGHLCLKKVVARNEQEFTFQAVHSRREISEHLKYPVVVEIIFPPSNSAHQKVYAHSRTCLSYYDGVSSLHTIFNVFEYLEKGDGEKLTPYPFTNSNKLNSVYYWIGSYVNFFSQLTTIYYDQLMGLFSKTFWLNDESWEPNSLMAYKTLPDRVSMRYTSIPKKMSFKDILKLFQKVKDVLRIPKVVTTVNMSPHVAIAIAPSFAEIKGVQGRYKWLTLPPAPPPPQGGFDMISNGVFFNNYGRHSPSFSGKIDDFCWDWNTLPDYFDPLFFVINIKGDFFVMAQFPKCLWPQASTILEPLGKGERTFSTPKGEESI